MEFHQLKTFIHVAELGSLSKAADRLNIAQPALSRQMRLLEEELGVKLFERHGRGMAVTDIGREILDQAANVLAGLDSIRNIAASGHTHIRGVVMVGMPPTVAEIVTVPLVRRLREKHPELAVRFSSAFSGHLLDWLQRGELEVSLSYDPEPQRSLTITPVMEEKLLYFEKGTGKPAKLRTIGFAELARTELVLPSPRHGLRNLLEFYARQAGVSLRPSVEAESLTAMVDLVRAGLGGTILPLAPLHDLVEEGALAAHSIVDPEPVRKLVVAYPADRRRTPAARAVGATFIEIARELVDQKIWAGRMLDADPPIDG
ncbi:LysR family transcriptional regulator [Aliihoeflea sp. PC F10.4]